MKSQILKNKLLSTILALGIPAFAWWGATECRALFITPRCAITPQLCSKESVSSVDRLSLGMEDLTADLFSLYTQNLAGIVAIIFLVLWNSRLSFSKTSSSRLNGLTSLGRDLLTLGKTVAWNGTFTEISHLISKRPRPFVYSDLAVSGLNPAHYTSFYSGHTSFTAASTLCVVFILVREKAPLGLILLASALSEALIISTAYFRILAGRHFLTDVITGAIAGSLVAWMICQFESQKKPPV